MSRRQLAVAAVLHFVLAVLVLQHTWIDPAHLLVGPATVDAPGYGSQGSPNGDNLVLAWFTAWTPFALSHLHDPLLTTWVNANAGANLMWNPLMPLAGLAVWPVALLAGPVVAFNALATLAIALCGLAATGCATRFVARPAVAVIAGVVFELSPFTIVQSQGHQPVVLGAVLAPVVLLILMDVLVLRRRSVRAGGVLLGLAAAATFYTWEESLALVAIAGLVGLGAALIAAPASCWQARGRAVPCLAIAAGVAALLMLPGLAVQFLGPQRLVTNIRPDNVYVTDLVNLITPTHVQLLAPGIAVTASHAWTGNSNEWDGYLGIPMLLLAAVTVFWLRRRRIVLWLGMLMAAGMVLELGPLLHVAGHETAIALPSTLLRGLPLFDNLVTGRFALVAALAASLLLAIVVEATLDRGRVAAAVLTVAAVLLTLAPQPLDAAGIATPAFFTSGAAQRIPEGSVALVAPYANPLSARPLIWQAESGMRFRMPEGSVFLPAPNGAGVLESPPETVTSRVMKAIEHGDQPVLDAATRQSMLADLRRWKVQTVIVGDMSHADRMTAVFTDLLGRPPSRDGGVAVWWSVLV